MKHYGRFLIQVTILLATFLLTACHDDNEPTSDPHPVFLESGASHADLYD